MILTHEAIIKARIDGLIVIEPFDERLVSINSVDVRLGADMWQPSRSRAYRDLYNPKDSDWTKMETVALEQCREILGDITFGEGSLNSEDRLFILKSGHFYLGTTLEKIGTKSMFTTPEFRINGNEMRAIVPKMKAKSTIGRQGLTVALCAGLGDVGYKSRWALEIRVTDDGDIPIAIGTPIGQVEFAEATPSEKTYSGSTRYQDGDVVRFLPKPIKMIRSDT